MAGICLYDTELKKKKNSLIKWIIAKSTHRLALCGAAGQLHYSHRRTGCAKNHNNNTWSLFEVLAKGCTDTRAGAAACSVIARELPHSRRRARTYAGARETQKRFDVIRQRNICTSKPSPRQPFSSPHVGDHLRPPWCRLNRELALSCKIVLLAMGGGYISCKEQEARRKLIQGTTHSQGVLGDFQKKKKRSGGNREVI